MREVQEYFSRNVSDWDALYGQRDAHSYNYRARAAAALRMLGWVKRQRGAGLLLDIGTGAGVQAAAAEAAGWNVVGVDLSFGMLERATANAPNGLWVVASADALPFRPGTFKAAMMLGVLGYLARPVESLREVHESLVPDGHLVVSTLVNQRRLLDRAGDRVSAIPDRLYGAVKRAIARVAPRAMQPGAPSFFETHNTRRTERQVVDLLTHAGWQPLHRVGVDYGEFRFMGKRLWPVRFDEAISGALTWVGQMPGIGIVRRTAMTTLILAIRRPE